MITRGFLINLGVTILASTLLFLYFRHRFKQVEHKVNTIFQLVQNHSQSSCPIRVSSPRPPPAIQFQEKNELIPVSDDEQDSGSESGSITDSASDSDEESDTEVMSMKRDRSENIFLGLGEIKQVAVTLTPDIPLVSNNAPLAPSAEMGAEKTNDLDDVGSLSSNDDMNDGEEDEVINIIKVGDDEGAKMEQAPQEPPVEEIQDYSKLTVPVLKEIAASKGFTNVRKLRKRALVELLSN